MSARRRLDAVEDLLTQADALRLDPTDTDYEPGIERLALLLEGLTQAAAAVAEALVDAAPVRGTGSGTVLAAGTPTRPDLGGGVAP